MTTQGLRKTGHQVLVVSLIALQIWQPVLADVVANHPQITQSHAVNGVPIINIATPSHSGISHNTYGRLDVDAAGLIFNNSGQPVNTQLGGYIPGNANLAQGSARLILNEVSGSLPSQLHGYMEIAGQKAEMVIANPAGITCNGCGFINTSRGTLTTGKPLFGNDGALNGFQVDNGQLVIDGLGLNASNTDRLSLYGRALVLNAELHAQDLQVVAGVNSINALTGAATAQSVSSDVPFFAIDSSNLGGMYANRIRLVGTEAGVGMRMAAPVAAMNGNLEITNNGDVRLARSSASSGLNVQTPGHLELTGAMTSDGSIAMTVGRSLLSSVSVEAGGNLDIQANALQNSGSYLRAEGDLTLKLPDFDRAAIGGNFGADGRFSVLTTNNIVFGGAEVSTPGALSLISEAGEIHLDGRVVSGGDTDLRATNIFIGTDGFLTSQRALSVSAINLNNLGLLYGRDALTLQIENILNNGRLALSLPASLLSDGDIHINRVDGGVTAEVNNWGSRIESITGGIDISASRIRNINIGWSLDSTLLPTVYSYSPNQTRWETYYGIGVSSTKNMHAYRYARTTRDYEIAYGFQGNVVAGGDITLLSDIIENDRSIISAGDDLLIRAKQVYNTGTEATDIIDVVLSDRWHVCEVHTNQNTTCHTKEVISFLPDEYGETSIIPAIIEGRNSAVIEGATASCATDQQGQSGVVCPKESRGSQSNMMATDWTSLPIGLPSLLPASGLFRLTPPSYPYLIETDPALNTYAGFLGSAYLLSHLEWSPEITQRRLGDGYYEIMQIREALLASTGSRFVAAGIIDEREQYEYLMRNSIAASESLHLSPGVALSREQIDALQQDIVWLEERSVAGEKVLIPVVYLAKGSTRLLQTGAIIGGGMVSLDGESIVNAGTLRARNTLTVNATKDIHNLGGVLEAGDDLQLNSGGDILNESGRLSGNNVVLQAEGDITHRTWAQYEQFGEEDNGNWYTQIGDTATVEARGEQIQSAGGSIKIVGGQLTGNNVALAAGGSILLDAVKMEQGHSFGGSDWAMSENQIRQVQTKVSALQQLQLQAGTDIIAIAAAIAAGNSASLKASNNILLLAAEESEHSRSYLRQDSSFGRSESHDVVHDETRLLGTSITVGHADTPDAAAGNFTLQAGNDIILYASQATATGQADVNAGGNLNLIAGINTVSHSEQHRKEGVATYRNNNQGYTQQTAASSAIAAGGDLNLNALNNIHITASAVTSGQTLRIGEETVDAAALTATHPQRPINVTIDTLALTNESWNETQKGLKGPLKELAKGLSMVFTPMLQVFSAGLIKPTEIEIASHSKTRTTDILAMGSALQADTLNIAVRDQVALINTDVNATGKATITANDIVIGAIAETHSVMHEEGRETVTGMGAKLGKDEVRVAGIKMTKQSLRDTETLVEWNGTTINAGQLVLNAQHDLAVLGAAINVSGDAVLSAGNELMIGGNEGILTREHKDTTEIITVSASIRNAYLDAALAVKALADAAEAIKDAKRALSEAEDRASRGELDPDGVKYFHMNLTAATANLVQMEIAMAAALAAGAAAAGTGFYVSGSAVRDKTVTTSTTTQGQWQGSNIAVGGNAALIAGEKIKIQGSDVNVGKALVVDAKKIALIAGEEHSSSKSKTTQENEGFSMSSLGGGSINAGLHQSDADSQGTHYVNTHLNTGTLASTSDSLQLAGAVIEADHVGIRTGALSVVSLQDTYQSKSKTVGGNVGISGGQGGVTGASIAADFQKSETERRWVDEQSGIIGHDSLHITADDMLLTGALIANATRGENGHLVDQGNLQLKTNTLVVNNLYDVDRAKTIGANLAVGINIGSGTKVQGTQTNAPAGTTSTGAAAAASKGNVPLNSITAGGLYTGHVTERTTFATVGMGQVEVGGELLTTENGPLVNRDVANTQVITRDQDIGGLNASVTVDGRWFSEAGRAEMLHQQANMGTNAQAVVRGVGSEIETGIELGAHLAGAENPSATTEKIVGWVGAGGVIPTALNNGGLLAQISGQFLPGSDANQRQMVGASADSAYVLAHPEMGWTPIEETPGYHLMNPAQQERMKNVVVSTNPIAIAAGTATYQNATNGMLNTPALALYNAVTQTHDMINDSAQQVLVTLNYNPTRGVIADGLESLQDKLAIDWKQEWMATDVAVDTGIFANQVMLARGNEQANFANHSQGNLLNFSGLLAVGVNNGIVLGPNGDENFTWNMFGSPVSTDKFDSYLKTKGMTLSSSSVNDGDFVGQGLGGNYGLFVAGQDGKVFSTVHHLPEDGNDFEIRQVSAITLDKAQKPSDGQSPSGSIFALFGQGQPSPHSNYSCVVRCGVKPVRTTLSTAKQED
jgi:filamentous hemagglutinin family protein